MIRTALAALFLTVYTLVLGPPFILYTVLTGHPDPLYRAGVGGVLFIVRLIGGGIGVDARETIPAGVCLFVANHTSAADAPAVVGSIPRRVSIMAKESLFRIPIVGQAFHAARFVPVNRSDRESAIASVEKAIGYIRQGASFLIYPEGPRSDDGRLQAVKKGAFVMAIKAAGPVVPVGWSRPHLVLRNREVRLRRGHVLVRFWSPLDASQYTMEQRDALSQRVHAEMAEALPPDQRPLENPLENNETESQEVV